MKKILSFFVTIAMVLTLGFTLAACGKSSQTVLQIYDEFLNNEGISVNNFGDGMKIEIADLENNENYVLYAKRDEKNGLQFSFEDCISNILSIGIYLKDNLIYYNILLENNENQGRLQGYEYYDDMLNLQKVLLKYFDSEYVDFIFELLDKRLNTAEYIRNEFKELDNVGGCIEKIENEEIKILSANGEFENCTQELKVIYTDNMLTQIKNNLTMKNGFILNSTIERCEQIVYPEDLDKYDVDLNLITKEEFKIHTNTKNNFTNKKYKQDSTLNGINSTAIIEFDDNGLKTYINYSDSETVDKVYLVDGILYYNHYNFVENKNFKYKRQYNPNEKIDETDIMYGAYLSIASIVLTKDANAWDIYQSFESFTEFEILEENFSHKIVQGYNKYAVSGSFINQETQENSSYSFETNYYNGKMVDIKIIISENNMYGVSVISSYDDEIQTSSIDFSDYVEI